MERDEIERDAEGFNLDEAKEIYEEIFAKVEEKDRPDFQEWLQEVNSNHND
jgi:hypothetical protein